MSHHMFPSIASKLFLLIAVPALTLAMVKDVGAKEALPKATTEASTDSTGLTAKPADLDILVVKGKKFPKVAPIAGTKSMSSCCNLGDTRTTTGKAVIDIATAQGTKKTKYNPPEGPYEAKYSPPQSCWVISDYQRVINSANPPYTAKVDAVPANYSYVTSSQYQSVYEELRNYALNLNILDKYKADIVANLSEFVQNYGSYASSISASHGSVVHTARVQGRGAFNGSSGYNAHVNTTETCCPPEIRNASDLKTTLTNWINQRVAKLPKKTKAEAESSKTPVLK
jgi:hypothetical protein